jgi:hypothetical protein
MEFHDCPIILHKQMLEDELSAVRQNLVEFREGPAGKSDFDLLLIPHN